MLTAESGVRLPYRVPNTTVESLETIEISRLFPFLHVIADYRSIPQNTTPYCAKVVKKWLIFG